MVLLATAAAAAKLFRQDGLENVEQWGRKIFEANIIGFIYCSDWKSISSFEFEERGESATQLFLFFWHSQNNKVGQRFASVCAPLEQVSTFKRLVPRLSNEHGALQLLARLHSKQCIKWQIPRGTLIHRIIALKRHRLIQTAMNQTISRISRIEHVYIFRYIY